MNLINLLNPFSIIKIKPYYCCCFSILNFLYPLHVVCQKSEINIFEKGCVGLTITAILCNQLFWHNPVRYNFYHKIDGIVAKITFFYFLGYTHYKQTLSINQFFEYYFIIFMMGLTFYISNYYSSRNWCSYNHLYIHMVFHLFSSFGMVYAYK